MWDKELFFTMHSFSLFAGTWKILINFLCSMSEGEEGILLCNKREHWLDSFLTLNLPKKKSFCLLALLSLSHTHSLSHIQKKHFHIVCSNFIVHVSTSYFLLHNFSFPFLLLLLSAASTTTTIRKYCINSHKMFNKSNICVKYERRKSKGIHFQV